MTADRYSVLSCPCCGGPAVDEQPVVDTPGWSVPLLSARCLATGFYFTPPDKRAAHWRRVYLWCRRWRAALASPVRGGARSVLA